VAIVVVVVVVVAEVVAVVVVVVVVMTSGDTLMLGADWNMCGMKEVVFFLSFILKDDWLLVCGDLLVAVERMLLTDRVRDARALTLLLGSLQKKKKKKGISKDP